MRFRSTKGADFVRHGLDRIYRRPLPCVDLYLDPYSQPLLRLGQQVCLRFASDPGPHLEAELPSERRDGGRELLDASRSRPDIVEILAVPAGCLEMKLVEAGPSAESQFLAKVSMIGDLADKTAEKEVLFDLGCASARERQLTSASPRQPGSQVGLQPSVDSQTPTGIYWAGLWTTWGEERAGKVAPLLHAIVKRGRQGGLANGLE